MAFTQSVNYTGSNPTVGPIPTIDVATSSVSSHITSECYDAADYPSDYWFSIYNGTALTSTTRGHDRRGAEQLLPLLTPTLADAGGTPSCRCRPR